MEYVLQTPPKIAKLEERVTMRDSSACVRRHEQAVCRHNRPDLALEELRPSMVVVYTEDHQRLHDLTSFDYEKSAQKRIGKVFFCTKRGKRQRGMEREFLPLPEIMEGRFRRRGMGVSRVKETRAAFYS